MRLLLKLSGVVIIVPTRAFPISRWVKSFLIESSSLNFSTIISLRRCHLIMTRVVTSILVVSLVGIPHSSILSLFSWSPHLLSIPYLVCLYNLPLRPKMFLILLSPTLWSIELSFSSPLLLLPCVRYWLLMVTLKRFRLILHSLVLEIMKLWPY